MNLTVDQKLILLDLWNVLKNKLITFASNTREKNVKLEDELINIKNNTLKEIPKSNEQDITLAKDFIDFVIDTVAATKSIRKTIEKVELTYKL